MALLTELQPVLINSPCFSQVPLKRKKAANVQRGNPSSAVPPYPAI